jgi:hypothetical protein
MTAGGHYRVYYKTSENTQNWQENYYFIEKKRSEIVVQMKEAIKNNKAIIVYYDAYIGFKGLFAPETAPITRIEILD